MKTITKLFLSLCLVVGLGVTLSANAQIESDATIKANIPYAFVVNNTTLPAGTYMITVADSNDAKVLEIKSAKGKMSVYFDTDPINLAHSMRHSELVFDKVGDTYFLSRVFLQGDESGNQLRKSKMQRRLEEGGLTAASTSIGAERISVKRNMK